MHFLAVVLVGLVLVVMFPRAMGLIALIVVGLIVWAVASGVQSNNERQKTLAQMSIDVTYDVAQCSPEYPIRIVLRNSSSATVIEYSLDVIARRQGHSDIAVTQHVRDDKIIGPQTAYGTCWSVSGLDRSAGVVKGIPIADLNWSFRNANVSF